MAAEKIQLHDVSSSNISALGYNAEKQIAALRFKSGDIFHYAEFPGELMAEWLGAESIGRFYALNVRGKFPGRKMTGHCPDCGAHGWVGDRCNDCGCSDFADDPRKEKAADDASA